MEKSTTFMFKISASGAIFLREDPEKIIILVTSYFKYHLNLKSYIFSLSAVQNNCRFFNLLDV